MKLSWGFVASSLYCAVAAVPEGHVYIFDPTPRSPPPATVTVNPITARLILAQRLGVSRFHSIGKTTSEEGLEQISAFGGRQQKLFGGDEDTGRTQAHALVWIDGVEDAQALIKHPEMWSSSFTIETPPPAAECKRLVEDMALQAESMPAKPDPKGDTYVSGEYIDFHLSKLRQPSLHNDYLSVLYIDLLSRDRMAKPSLESIAAAISNLQLVEPGDVRFAITLVVMPPSTRASKLLANPYGSYDNSHLQARREPKEAPLSLSAAEPATSPNTVPDLESFPVITQADSGNNTTPPLGILPRCFETESACDKATNQCSGHGKCSLTHKGESGTNGRKDCYSCVCKASVEHTETGMEMHTKTTYWGGPACQKKDISVPFWLFVTSGVLFAFLISGGIGLLYSVGSEELPSVIGAGVSGPVRK